MYFRLSQFHWDKYFHRTVINPSIQVDVNRRSPAQAGKLETKGYSTNYYSWKQQIYLFVSIFSIHLPVPLSCDSQKWLLVWGPKGEAQAEMHSFTTWVTGAKNVRTQRTNNEKAISPQTFWLRGSSWTILIRCDLDTKTLQAFVLFGSVHSIASIFIGQYILNTFTSEIITELSELWLANKCSKRALSLAFYFTCQA